MKNPRKPQPNSGSQRLTLDGPATYQITVPGHLDAGRADWADPMRLATETDARGRPTTTLTGAVDQAALLGLLRRLNSLGLPLISVCWLDVSQPRD